MWRKNRQWQFFCVLRGSINLYYHNIYNLSWNYCFTNSWCINGIIRWLAELKFFSYLEKCRYTPKTLSLSKEIMERTVSMNHHLDSTTCHHWEMDYPLKVRNSQITFRCRCFSWDYFTDRNPIIITWTLTFNYVFTFRSRWPHPPNLSTLSVIWQFVTK